MKVIIIKEVIILWHLLMMFLLHMVIQWVNYKVRRLNHFIIGILNMIIYQRDDGRHQHERERQVAAVLAAEGEDQRGQHAQHERRKQAEQKSRNGHDRRNHTIKHS